MINRDIKRNKHNDFNQSEALINRISLYMQLLDNGRAASDVSNRKGVSLRTFQRYLADLKKVGAVPNYVRIQSEFNEEENRESYFVECKELRLKDYGKAIRDNKMCAKVKDQTNFDRLIKTFGEPFYINEFYNVLLPTDDRLTRLCALFYIQSAFKQEFYNDNYHELKDFYMTKVSPGLSMTTFERDRDILKLAIAGAFCDSEDFFFTNRERKYFNRY